MPAIRKRLINPHFVPTGPVEVNWSHPLAQGLTALHVPGSMYGPNDLCGLNPGKATFVNASTPVLTPSGPAYLTDGSTSYIKIPQAPSNILANNTFSFFCDVNDAPVPNDDGCMWGKWFGGSNWGIALLLAQNSGNTTTQIRFHNGGDGTVAWNYRYSTPHPQTIRSLCVADVPNLLFTNYVDGGLDGTIGMGAPLSYQSNQDWAMGCYLDGGTPAFLGSQATSRAGIYNRLLNAGEAAWLAAEPFAMLQRKIKRTYFSFSGGNVYAVSLVETASATDTVSDTDSMVSALVENATATDTISDKAVMSGTLVENASATATVTDTATLPSALVENASAIDTVSDIATLPSVLVENASATDTISNGAIYSQALVENATATDAVTDVAVLPSALVENASATATVTDVAVLPSALVENASATDTISDIATLPSALVENANATDTISDIATLPSALVENANATDTINTGGGIYSGVLVENANATDTVTDAAVLPSALVENASATATISAAGVASVSLVEQAAATDTLSATAQLVAILNEMGAATDQYLAIFITNLVIIEQANATDTIDATAGVLPYNPCDVLAGAGLVRVLEGCGLTRVLTGGGCC